MSAATSYYELFGCKTDASRDELKAAFYQFLRNHHPDKKGPPPSRDLSPDDKGFCLNLEGAEGNEEIALAVRAWNTLKLVY